MSSLWDGALLSRVCRELKSRLATPASSFLRFAFGAAGAKSELKGNKAHNDRQNAARTKDGGELTGGRSLQQALRVSSVAFRASILTSPQKRPLVTSREALRANDSPPTLRPSDPPTLRPSDPPTLRPSDPPTRRPSDPPTRRPSDPPTLRPSDPPTLRPADPPTLRPSDPPLSPPSS
ncbi:hypothetical protein EYF80_003896 [Liparis tanakae]|uniref:Uncharacterized protein n=1 Tax=Liparis tanakae TaxID=230148 RepID=A0A4Z2J9E6_9TELE|nr:hypothetical protein EYF80_003896 [Liparis tanakae]